MNFAELYSLTSGKKIDKIYTFEKYYPLPFDKNIIVIQPQSKNSKNYPYWDTVLGILLPIFKKNNYNLVQVGAANEKLLNGCFHTQGQTSWGQLQYIISHSELVL